MDSKRGRVTKSRKQPAKTEGTAKAKAFIGRWEAFEKDVRNSGRSLPQKASVKKAYGFPLGPVAQHEDGVSVTGMCVDQDGKLLGYWTSSSVALLKTDLKNHAQGYDYSFSVDVPYEIERKIDQSLKGRR